jgi:hypothetical protein
MEWMRWVTMARSTMKVIIAASITILIAFSATQARAGKFDGEWRGEGKLSCGSFGGSEQLSLLLIIDDGTLSADFSGHQKDYEIIGNVDKRGKLKNAFLIGSYVASTVKLRGKLSVDDGHVEFLAMDKMYDHPCEGSMILTKTSRISEHKHEESDSLRSDKTVLANRYDGIWAVSGLHASDCFSRQKSPKEIIFNINKNEISSNSDEYTVSGYVNSYGIVRAFLTLASPPTGHSPSPIRKISGNLDLNTESGLLRISHEHTGGEKCIDKFTATPVKTDIKSSFVEKNSTAKVFENEGITSHKIIKIPPIKNISVWLKSINLEKYDSEFLGNDVTMDILSELTDADLKEMGIKSLGARKRILKAAKEL